MSVMIFLTACCIGIPLLAAWCKDQFWLWDERRKK